MFIDHRNNDAVLTICQNNKIKSIIISEANEVAKGLIGLETIDLVGKHLDSILPPRIAELLAEYVEFEDDANDVGAVLSKVQSFSIIGRNGKENAYRIKIVRMPSSGNSLFFSIVLQDVLENRRNEAIRKIIRDNFKGHESLDSYTGLPNRTSLIKDIELMKRHSNSGDVLSCFAILQIDHYTKLVAHNGISICNEILKHVASIINRSLRPDDVVGSIGDGRLGILLVDIMRGSERLVLNRLRWQIASNPYVMENKISIGLSVSISFCAIDGNSNEQNVVEKCEISLNDLDKNSHNILVNA